VPISTSENHCLEGRLTFGDPFLDSDVGDIAPLRFNGPASSVNAVTSDARFRNSSASTGGSNAKGPSSCWIERTRCTSLIRNSPRHSPAWIERTSSALVNDAVTSNARFRNLIRKWWIERPGGVVSGGGVGFGYTCSSSVNDALTSNLPRKQFSRKGWIFPLLLNRALLTETKVESGDVSEKKWNLP